MAGRDLAGAARGAGADRDAVEVQRDHLGVGPHARAAPGRWCWAAAARRRRRPRRPRPRAACSAASRSARQRRRVVGRQRRGGEPGDRRRPAACRRAGRAPARRRRSAAAIAADAPAPAAARPPPSGRPACATTAPGCPRRGRQDRPPCARPPAPHRHAARAPWRAAQRGRLGDRLQRAGLVVGQHQADQRRRARRPAEPASASRSATPSRSTGSTAAPGAAARTASCSVAPTMTMPASGAQRVDRQRVRLGAAGGEHQVGWPAAEARRQRFARVLQTRRAARPAACTEDGLPVTSSAAGTAARASGRSGSVALASR